MNGGIQVGPARVLAVEADGRPRVQTLGPPVVVAVADWAIPFRYQPARGDLLLVIGRRGRFWVTGIVEGSGASTLAFAGDLELHAEGRLTLGSVGGVRVDGPTIRIETEEHDTDAGQIVQRIGDADVEAEQSHEERCGASTRLIDGDDELVAGRVRTVAAKAVRIDGSLIRIS